MSIARLLIGFILIGIVSACPSGSDKEDKQTEEDATKNDELVLAVGGETEEGFDPTTGWGMYGSPLFQSTLLKYDKEFKIENDIAVEHDVSESGLEYTVEIREDIKFSDEEPLTAEDVVFTFETAKESDSVIDLSNLEDRKSVV